MSKPSPKHDDTADSIFQGFPASKWLSYVSLKIWPHSANYQLMQSAGPTRLGHPNQRPPPLSRHFACTRRDQLWLSPRSRRHRLRLQRSPHLLLHHLYRLCAPEALARRRVAPTPILARKMGWSDQRCCIGILVCRVRLQLLPN